jgi:hypothetical protein
MWLSGAVPARYNANPTSSPVTISFDPNDTGPGVMIPWSCYSCKVSDILLQGNSCWIAGEPSIPITTSLVTYDPPAYTFNAAPLWSSSCSTKKPGITPAFSGFGPDGVEVTGGEPTIERVTAQCFKRHGFALIGDNSAEECVSGGAEPLVCPCVEQPDDWSMTDDYAISNRGFGLITRGEPPFAHQG